jgi:hypothetical protein
MFRLARSVSRSLGPVVRFVGDLTLDGFHFLGATLRSRTAVSAEILFLRKQLAFYQEHQIRPRLWSAKIPSEAFPMKVTLLH